MKLEHYLIAKGLKQHEFAAMIGTSQPTVYRICNGDVPRKDLMLAIVRVTLGAVQPNDFYGVPTGPIDDEEFAKFLQSPNN